MMANARNASLETLYDDQFALLTQLIKPNYLEKYESSMIKFKKKKKKFDSSLVLQYASGRLQRAKRYTNKER